ncbi:MAG: putative sugar nucleotidyl transferase [bacterium]|nr:putative sugar nucleotidyl transferase [bacterium]
MSKDYIVVFEDEYYHRFYPISLSRPTFNLLAGSKTNLERIKHHFSEFEIFTICRPHLSTKSNISHQFNRLLLINGRALFRSSDLAFINELKNTDDSVAYIKNGSLIAAVLSPKTERDLLQNTPLYDQGQSEKIIQGVKKSVDVDILTLDYIWDPLSSNQELLKSDFDEYFKEKNSPCKIGDSFAYGRSQIATNEDLSADTFSVIDAREGPVIIGKGVKISPFTYLEGPAFIGDGCRLVGGKITAGCSLGNGCRIGGEVENSIFVGNSNKYHEGFIGHSYIGEWVNLGSLTTNSDLKNNYSEISIKQNGTVVKTGSIKIGCFIGDHTKTGIGSLLNTGAVIGFSCNLFGGGLIMEKEIPSFAWGNDSLRHTFSLKKAVETAEIVLKRRNAKFNENRLFEHIFNESAIQREIWLNKS